MARAREPRFDGAERQSAFLSYHGVRLILKVGETQKLRLFGRVLDRLEAMGLVQP